MPQYTFVQVIVVAAIAAFLGTAFAFPIGARFGSRAGSRVLRGSIIGLLVIIAVCLLWANGNGELAAFNRQLGADGWIQIGGFFLVVLFTSYGFTNKYLNDKAREEREAASA